MDTTIDGARASGIVALCPVQYQFDRSPAPQGASSISTPYQCGGGAFFALAKLKGPDIIRAAAMHNKREQQSRFGIEARFDRSRSHLNLIIRGPRTATEVAQHAQLMMLAAGVGKLRKDAVRAMEIIMSVSTEHRLDHQLYFSDGVDWIGRYFGGADNVLAADFHLDERAPHCHVLVLPLQHGKMNGSAMVGGPGKFRRMLERFHNEVATPHGLQRDPDRLSGTEKQAAVAAVLRWFTNQPGSGYGTAMWPAMHHDIQRDPRRYLSHLRTASPSTGATTCAPLVADPKFVLPDRAIGLSHQSVHTDGLDQRLCSVGFASAPEPTSTPQDASWSTGADLPEATIDAPTPARDFRDQ